MKFLKKSSILIILSFSILTVENLYSEPKDLQSSKKVEFKKEDNKEYVTFSPPEGWRVANPQDLPSSVKFMVVGKGSHDFPPSINLGTEKVSGTLQQYLNTIKEINRAQGAVWKDLGSIRTNAGSASLSQVDVKTEWGDVRMMHVILLKNGTSYILTAAALKEEFPQFYKDFFTSMRSLSLSKDPIDMITSSIEKKQVILEKKKLKRGWKKLAEEKNVNLQNYDEVLHLFNGQEFNENFWNPYTQKIKFDFAGLGKEWEQEMLNKTKEEIILEKISPTKISN